MRYRTVRVPAVCCVLCGWREAVSRGHDGSGLFQAERAEKEKMKRVVLDFHERQEEEDYQGE